MKKFAIKYWDGGYTPVYDTNSNEVVISADNIGDALDKFFAEHNIPYEDMDAMSAVEIGKGAE